MIPDKRPLLLVKQKLGAEFVFTGGKPHEKPDGSLFVTTSDGAFMAAFPASSWETFTTAIELRRN